MGCLCGKHKYDTTNTITHNNIIHTIELVDFQNCKNHVTEVNDKSLELIALLTKQKKIISVLKRGNAYNNINNVLSKLSWLEFYTYRDPDFKTYDIKRVYNIYCKIINTISLHNIQSCFENNSIQSKAELNCVKCASETIYHELMYLIYNKTMNLDFTI